MSAEYHMLSYLQWGFLDYIYILLKEKLQSLLITVTRLHGDRPPRSVLLLT